MARSAMVDAISRYAGRVSTIKRFVPENEARAEAKRTGSDYLVFLIILNWEERATAWSGMTDRLEIVVRTLDIGRNKVVDDRIISGNSAWATFGGDHVNHLLPEPFAGFAADIFGSTPIKK